MSVKIRELKNNLKIEKQTMKWKTEKAIKK